ncbi:MAG: DUF4340 domain-containing protein [Gammaproteobacteria bacterium]|nr:DUF4340 domain-containing protein [Gammaproteobacteria bacterium]
MKRSYLNLAMGVLVLALGAGVYFSQNKSAPPKSPLTALKPARIDRIEIDHPGTKPVVLERHGAQWRLTQPIQADADSYEVNGVLDLATAPIRRNLESSPVKRSNLGLEPPQYSVKFNDVTIKVGGIEPLRYQRYVEVGKRIALVDNPSSGALGKNYAELVSKRLLPAGVQIDKIELPGVTVARSADGKGWQISPPVERVAADAAQQLVDHWSEATALWTKLADDTDESRKAPGNPQYVTVTLQSGAPIRFLIAGHLPQLVLERQDIGIRYALGKDQADTLLRLATAKPATPASSAKPAAATGETGNAKAVAGKP